MEKEIILLDNGNQLSDYMDVVLGRPIRPGGGSAGLKWTVSPTRPQKAKAGELWVGADPSQVRINQAIHLQSSKKEVANPKPNAIYVIIPANGYSFVETPVTVDFFSNKKYRLNAQCPYVFVTGDSGEPLDIVRGVYTGTEWKTWGEQPDIPEQWEFVQAISASTTWTPPKPGQWYRVHVFGKCGDGGSTTGFKPGTTNYHSVGFSGGNTGGYACSIILLEDSVPCTINSSLTSFGAYLSATSGGSVGKDYNGSKVLSSVVGEGIGGTEYNIKGKQGTVGGDGSASSSESNYIHAGGNGGKGARLQKPYSDFPYINTTANFTVGIGGWARYDGGHDGNSTNGAAAAAYPTLNLNAPVLYGAGQGGGGNAVSQGGYGWGAGGKGSTGSPGLIIIEKGSTGGSTGPGQGGGDA